MVRNEDFNKTIICSKILKSYIDGVLYEIKESEGIYRFNHDKDLRALLTNEHVVKKLGREFNEDEIKIIYLKTLDIIKKKIEGSYCINENKIVTVKRLGVLWYTSNLFLIFIYDIMHKQKSDNTISKHFHIYIL